MIDSSAVAERKWNDFLKELNDFPIRKLPCFLTRGIYTHNQGSSEEYSCSVQDDTTLVINSFFSLNLVDDRELNFKIQCSKPKNVIYLSLLDRMPPLDEGNLETLLFNSHTKDTNSCFWVLVTMDRSLKEIIDSKVVAIFADATDLYYSSDIYFDKDNTLYSSIAVSYESPEMIHDKIFEVEGSGVIKIISTDDYNSGRDTIFRDYRDIFPVQSIPVRISNEKRKNLITKIENITPTLDLPLSLSKFDVYFTIDAINASAYIETKLKHEQLEHIADIDQILSEKMHSVAYRKVGDEFVAGDYFYPIFQFRRNNAVNVVCFLYQSFCNSVPAIYKKLVTFDPQGHVIDELIVDREFNTGEMTFITEARINLDFSIYLERKTIHYSEYKGEYGQNETKEKLTKEKFMLSDSGHFYKISN